MIGVAISSKKEWKEVLKVYNIKEEYTENYPYGAFYRTSLLNKDIVFFRTGNRKVNAAGAVQYMINKFDFDKIVLLGTCTMVTELDYGDVIIPNSVVEYDLTIREVQPLIFEKSIIKLSKTNIKEDYIDGLIGTSDKALVLWKDYLKLREETDVIASDMESAAVAKICKFNNKKLIIIKGVTDKPMKGEDGLDEQVDIYEENLSLVMKNLLENYLTEVIE